MYHYLDQKEAVEMLRKAGLNHGEINRLTKFRKQFSMNEMDQNRTDHRHLEFMRWLFKRGKITDFAN
jgi:hypothetical protein